jgi:betaine lipid synthase
VQDYLKRCLIRNYSQGHLAELKLAAIKALTHEEFFDLFGLGKIKNFRSLLDSRLSPFLSSHAYQFWRLNSDAFKSSFYRRGYSGWALRLAKFAFWMGGASGAVERLCKAETIEEQQKIWNESIRPIVLKPSLIKFVAENPVFLWNALGVRRVFHSPLRL